MKPLLKPFKLSVPKKLLKDSKAIDALAKSGEEGSSSKAEQLLVEMEQQSMKGHHLKPNTVTYSSVINAIAKSGEKGNQHYQGNEDVKPDSVRYNVVINARAFSKHPVDHKDAFEIAFRVFKQMTLKEVTPNDVTYTSLLNVCRRCLPKTDTEHRFIRSKSLFTGCCKAGFMNDYVLGALKKVVTEEQYVHLVGSSEQSSSHLPPDWTRMILKRFTGKKLVGSNYSKRV